MKNILKKLNEPFPEQKDFKYELRSMGLIAIFVTLFLYVFEPFGLNFYPGPYLFFICAGFGLVTILFGLLFRFIDIKVLKLQKDVSSWTLGKWIMNTLCLILTISVGNFLYLSLLNYGLNWDVFDAPFYAFLWMIVDTFLVGIFPIALSGLIMQLRASKQYQSQAADLQTNLSKPKNDAQKITLSSQNGNQSLAVETSTILFVESMQNYVTVHHLTEQRLQKTVLRNTISNIEQQLASTSVIRCHRSFLVNTDLVEKVAGNAQGLRLALTNLPETTIPVSRKYIATLRAQIS
ncbi:MAG: LytTR family DNA-binding domain-containing protein [Bacteroidota bacterium]